MNQNESDNYSQSLQDYFFARIKNYKDNISQTDLYIAYSKVRYTVNLIMGAVHHINLPKGSRKVSEEVFELSKSILDSIMPEITPESSQNVSNVGNTSEDNSNV